MTKGKWHTTGFNEGWSNAPADPPMDPGNRSHTAYLEGYAEGERAREADEAQAEAAEEGRRAEQEGRPVIYIHGRPYADPDAAEDASR